MARGNTRRGVALNSTKTKKLKTSENVPEQVVSTKTSNDIDLVTSTTLTATPYIGNVTKKNTTNPSNKQTKLVTEKNSIY